MQEEKHPTCKLYLLFPHSYISKCGTFDGNNSSMGTLRGAKISEGHPTSPVMENLK